VINPAVHRHSSMIRPIIQLTVLILGLGCAPGLSADFRSGVSAVKARDYETAFRAFLSEARNGHVQAQVYLANMYRRGYGTPRDYRQSAAWYLQAAEQGSASAQYNYAIHLRDGLGVLRDDTTATQWLMRAAIQSHTGAQINLGIRYATGRTVARDLVMGYAWLQRAAGGGNLQAKRRRDSLGRQMSEAQIKEARVLAYTLY